MIATRPELAGTFGMISSTHWLASQSGMAVLESGGNAFDAAVVAGFVLQVAEPHLCGPAGEVPILACPAGAERPTVICGQGVAPAAATLAAFAELDVSLIPGTGLLAACVPGAFGGWLELLLRHGTTTIGVALSYAIGYAEHGVPIVPRISGTIGTVAELFAADWPTSAAQWLPGGRPPQPWSLLANPALARTYRRIVAHAEAESADRDEQIEAARRAFYTGFVAEEIDAFCRTPVLDVTGDSHAGLLTYDDLAAWRAPVEDAVSTDYHGWTVHKAGPWSQGPVFGQQLGILSALDIGGLPAGSPELVHAVVEAAKLAFADREAFYGDPDHTDVPLTALLDPAYAADRAALVGDRAWVDGPRPGSPGGREPRLPVYPDAATPSPSAEGVGEPTVRTSGETRGDTCQVDVVDRWGNMVAATPSGGWLQSSPMISTLGFCLGTRAQMFWLADGLASSLVPGARPRTTLTPSLATRDGRAELAFGTPGGDQQDQWSLLLFLHLVHHGMGLQQAIDAPAWHTSDFASSFWPRESHPGRVHVEDRLGERTLAELTRRGHEVVPSGPWSLGRLCGVRRQRDGLLRAGADARSQQAYAVGR